MRSTVHDRCPARASDDARLSEPGGRRAAAQACQPAGHHGERDGVLVVPVDHDRRRARCVHPSGAGADVGEGADRATGVAPEGRSHRTRRPGRRGAASARQGGPVCEHPSGIDVPRPREVDLHRRPDGTLEHAALRPVVRPGRSVEDGCSRGCRRARRERILRCPLPRPRRAEDVPFRNDGHLHR